MKTNEFGTLLAQRRIQAGLSRRDLAEKVQVGTSTISHLEAGRRLPSVEVAIRLSKELNVSLDTLLAKVPA